MLANNINTVKVKYWHLLMDGRIQCDLCPRACKLKDGQQGLCFVRARHENTMVLTTYGKSSGFCIDPVEKKPLNHYLPGTSVLSFGTAGCNLACKFCQNWDISKSREMDTLAVSATPERIAKTAKKYSCTSVAFTYNDPVIFMEYASDVAQACHEYDIKTIAVTAAYICEKPRIEFFQYIDATNVDLKAFSEKFYFKITGSHLNSVLDSLLYIKHQTSTWLEITTLLIPGENDSSNEITKMTRWIADNLGVNVPLHFSAFHPDWKMKNHPATSLTILRKAREIALAQGLRYVYTGNVHDSDSASTYCHQCNTRLIARDWYVLGDWQLDNTGHCKKCGTLCSGIFDGKHGNWGAKRQMVYL
ncbi:COG1180: Radical SAM, Pyruvate-formate lyase-activating enzyme like [hydrothermal vent metagenome]|uniref:COG1180: Radical SAM, Pyruvate-formate lyase-activating enzyme like n=1 Tax=hydrothermal vent metagenome TaxID=652676 RepID=A0A3B0ZZV8_9ZZZZ